MSKENVKEISITYNIDKEDEKYIDGKYINIFGLEFVKNNKDKCKMIIDNKEYKITEKYNIENHNNNNKLKIKLKGINNVTDMSYMFDCCYSLSSLPDISKLNTSNVTNMSCMFFECSSLSSLPNISKWNTSNITNMIYMFSGCSSLSSLTDISKWTTSNVTNMIYMFY